MKKILTLLAIACASGHCFAKTSPQTIADADKAAEAKPAQEAVAETDENAQTIASADKAAEAKPVQEAVAETDESAQTVASADKAAEAKPAQEAVAETDESAQTIVSADKAERATPKPVIEESLAAKTEPAQPVDETKPIADDSQTVDVAASLNCVTAQVKKAEIEPIDPEHLEKLNRAIDPEEDVHVVTIDYENKKLKHMKIDAFVVNNDIQLSTTYILNFKGDTLEISIEDYLTGLETTIPPTSDEKQEYNTNSYHVKCFKKDEAYHSKFTRTCSGGHDKPLACGMTSCFAPAADELQVLQKMRLDDAQFVSSVQEGLKANIQAVLDEKETGVPFVITQAKANPGKLLKDLFAKDLRLYLFNNMLATLQKPEEPKTQEKPPKEHKDQG